MLGKALRIQWWIQTIEPSNVYWQQLALDITVYRVLHFTYFFVFCSMNQKSYITKTRIFEKVHSLSILNYKFLITIIVFWGVYAAIIQSPLAIVLVLSVSNHCSRSVTFKKLLALCLTFIQNPIRNRKEISLRFTFQQIYQPITLSYRSQCRS